MSDYTTYSIPRDKSTYLSRPIWQACRAIAIKRMQISETTTDDVVNELLTFALQQKHPAALDFYVKKARGEDEAEKQLINSL